MGKFKFLKPKSKAKEEKKTKEENSELFEQEYKRLLEALNECVPGTDDYDNHLKEVEKFQNMTSKKDEVEIQERDSRRKVTNKIIDTAGGLGIAGIFMAIEKNGIPLVGKTISTALSTALKRKP